MNLLPIIDYTQPPVIDFNDGELTLNGRWDGDRAVFDEVLRGPLSIRSATAWVWLDDGNVLPIDVLFSTHTITPGMAISVRDLQVAP